MASLTGFAAAAAVMIALMFAGESIGRELRPSEHGLEFQNSPPAWKNYSSEMRSFFNSSQKSNSSGMTMPRAMNSSDSSPSSWWRTTTGGGGGRNHVRVALVVASLVCGVTGVILLVVTGLLYLSKHRKHKVTESCGDKNNDKLQLVVSNP